MKFRSNKEEVEASWEELKKVPGLQDICRRNGIDISLFLQQLQLQQLEPMKTKWDRLNQDLKNVISKWAHPSCSDDELDDLMTQRKTLTKDIIELTEDILSLKPSDDVPGKN